MITSNKQDTYPIHIQTLQTASKNDGTSRALELRRLCCDVARRREAHFVEGGLHCRHRSLEQSILPQQPSSRAKDRRRLASRLRRCHAARRAETKP